MFQSNRRRDILTAIQRRCKHRMEWTEWKQPIQYDCLSPFPLCHLPSMGSLISEAFCITLALVWVCFSQAVQHTYPETHIWYLTSLRLLHLSSNNNFRHNWSLPSPRNKHPTQSSQGASQPVSPAGMHDKRPWEGEGLGSLWFSESETLGISLLWKAFLGIPSQEMQSALLGKNI